MNGRIVLAVLLAFLVFATYSWYSTKLEEDIGKEQRKPPFNMDYTTDTDPKEGFDVNKQQYETTVVTQPHPEAALNRVMSPGGPGAPNQRAPRTMPATVSEPERPFDPQEQSHESADLPERLRHPERSYSPGLVNDNVADAVAAGTASYASQLTQNATQMFGPEFAQNGGEFMDGGIMANDSALDMNYSSV